MKRPPDHPGGRCRTCTGPLGPCSTDQCPDCERRDHAVRPPMPGDRLAISQSEADTLNKCDECCPVRTCEACGPCPEHDIDTREVAR